MSRFYLPKLKFQIVLEVLTGKSPGQGLGGNPNPVTRGLGAGAAGQYRGGSSDLAVH